ncbi:hypothetical protein [Acaryochloris sp. CCMEE 5410]|uniref:hypothetical protein n=1 Tax=Acaryochloris sp. CCMEE 5410 TaxID=310037 RepID=UPI0021D26D8A|nr:hypothetical protein [Acaryochloris sp. CCMEE 5410]KAI9129024.1 hypothetical protein ON05_037150 [Acaryochloris sp. CCMEE 5410]
MISAWRSESLESLGKPKQVVLEIELMTIHREDKLLNELAEALQDQANTNKFDGNWCRTRSIACRFPENNV